MRGLQPDENVNMVNVGFNRKYLATQLTRNLRDEFFNPVTNLVSENGTPIFGTPNKVICECVLAMSTALRFQCHTVKKRLMLVFLHFTGVESLLLMAIPLRHKCRSLLAAHGSFG